MKLENKVALVTGGGQGIGKAVSLALAQEGARVTIADINEDGGRKVRDEIEQAGGKALFVRTDVSQSDDVDQMVKTTLDAFGGVDILVNCAGVISIAPVVELEEKEWDRNMTVNAKGVFLCCRAVARQMIKQGAGKIINAGSRLGKVGVPRYAHYCASKAAVIILTQALALELAPYRINVNAVAPGNIDTDMTRWEWEWDHQRKGISLAELEKEGTEAVPLGRLGTPEDVAKVIVFLASPEADYLTGQAINVTGGMEFR